jgi:hypothetical protein
LLSLLAVADGCCHCWQWQMVVVIQQWQMVVVIAGSVFVSVAKVQVHLAFKNL